MLPFIRWAGLVVLLACVLPVSGADTKKAGDDEKTEKKAEKKAAAPAKKAPDYVVVGTYNGEVKDAAQRSLTLVVMQYVPDASAQGKIANLQRQLASQRNPFQMAQIAQQIRQAQMNAQRGVQKKVEKLFEVSDDCVVRTAELPVEYDDQGKAKKLSPKDKLAKKGNPKLWGYPAEFDQVAKGQRVKVVVGVKKSALKRRKPRGKAAAVEDESEDAAPQIREIRILGGGWEKK